MGVLRIMAQSEPRRLGVSVELKPHAYDPATNPELFDGVVSRRVVAFLIDFLILSIPVVFVSMFIFVIGIVTFGLDKMRKSIRNATTRRDTTPSNSSGLVAGS